jgi:Type IV secretion system pilin
MFSTSTIKSIFKTIAVAAVLSAIAVIAIPNITASAQTRCPDGSVVGAGLTCPATGTAGGGANANLTPNVCGTSCPLTGTASGAGLADRGTVSNFILSFARFFIFIAAAVAVLFIVWGGYNYISAGGDDKRALTGKNILVNALIGLAICILSLTIVSFISGTLEGNLAGSIIGGR